MPLLQLGFIRGKIPAPPKPEGSTSIEPPAEFKRPIASKPPVWVWVVIFVAALLIFIGWMFVTGVRQISPYSLFLLPVMMVSMLGMARGGGNKDNKPAVLNDARAGYDRYLDQQRAKIHLDAREQAEEVSWYHPDPSGGALGSYIGTRRMWDRTRKDANFGHVRLGLGISRLAKPLHPPTSVAPPEDLEPIQSIAAREFLSTQAVVHDIPRPLHLFDHPGYSFFGRDRKHLQGVLRALCMQLCVFHGPDDVLVPIITDDIDEWEWAKWLPHCADPELVDAAGPARLIFGSVEEFMTRFTEDLEARSAHTPKMTGGEAVSGQFLVVVVDLPGADCAPILGATGKLGVSVLEMTNNGSSLTARNRDRVFVADDIGNLLKPVPPARRSRPRPVEQPRPRAGLPPAPQNNSEADQPQEANAW